MPTLKYRTIKQLSEAEGTAIWEELETIREEELSKYQSNVKEKYRKILESKNVDPDV